MSPDNILRTVNISKSYGNRVIVDNLNIDIKSGCVRGILGPNGAGKTTSFYMLAGIISPDKGQVFLNDVDITLLSLPQRAKLGIGYLPQEASVFRALSVADNISAVLELRKGLSSAKRLELLDMILEKFQLTKIKSTMGDYVSGGERRRVEVARAYALNPKFLLLDEPFAGVDPVSITEIKQIILQLRKDGVGVIITDHNVRDTLAICDTADILYKGNIIASGIESDILSNAKVRQVYLGEEFTT